MSPDEGEGGDAQAARAAPSRPAWSVGAGHGDAAERRGWRASAEPGRAAARSMKAAGAVGAALNRAARATRPTRAALRAIWLKLNDDWIFNLASLLAYNLLMSIVPILLLLIAAFGFVFGAISHDARLALTDGIVRLLPLGVGRPIVQTVLEDLRRNAGFTLLFGVISALFLGSRLFIVVEDCFGIIFGLPSRSPVRQNLIALGMLLAYLLLLPLVFLAPTLVELMAGVALRVRAPTLDLHIRLAAMLATFLSGVLLFGSMYVVLPNRRVRWREVWKGTTVASALLAVYQQIFPLYEQHFLRPSDPGSVLGLILIALIFFYYFAFILLLGAEVNAWAYGRRERRTPVSWLLKRRGSPRAAADPANA